MPTDDDATPTRVTGSPDAIWLQYGEIDRDCTHSECSDVTWAEDSIYASDVRYVRADLAEANRSAIEAVRDTAMSTLRLIADRPRRTREQRLASSCVQFLDSLVAGRG